MTKRSESREWAVQLLFQREINREDMQDTLELFWRDKKPASKAKASRKSWSAAWKSTGRI